MIVQTGEFPKSTFPINTNWQYFNYKCGTSGFTKAIKQDRTDLGRLKVQALFLGFISGLTASTYEPCRLPENNRITIHRTYKDTDLDAIALTANLDMEFCLVPRQTQLGDAIFIAFGSRMPLILHAHNADEFGDSLAGLSLLHPRIEWRVIRLAWILELIWGEAMKGVEIEKP
jgi:hypothetical protein